MTIPDFINIVGLSKKKKEKQKLVTAKTICAVILGIHISLLLWHVSFWF